MFSTDNISKRKDHGRQGWRTRIVLDLSSLLPYDFALKELLQASAQRVRAERAKGDFFSDWWVPAKIRWGTDVSSGLDPMD